MNKKGLLSLVIPLFYFLEILLISQTGYPLRWGINLTISGLLIAVVGILIWAAGFVALNWRALTVLPKAKILVTNRIYHYFRHPIYLGISLSCLGLSLAMGSSYGLLYLLFLIIPLNILRAKNEEKILIQKYGPQYIEYKKDKIF